MELKVLSKKISEMSKKFGIRYAILFGSYAKGRKTEESDIDIALKLKRHPNNLFKFLKDFVDELGIEGVDVVILNSAPNTLKFEIFRNGVVLFCEDKEEYFNDLLSMIKWYDDWHLIKKYFEKRELKKVSG
ncbi:MAG: nucleotidyltransferase domain-containing protein [Candidatus Aenigmarchaeota archaeon]|nr:nucleotidyltransferase domain-containing protein [Candidatus Aenigmarchaeota archaeon]